VSVLVVIHCIISSYWSATVWQGDPSMTHFAFCLLRLASRAFGTCRGSTDLVLHMHCVIFFVPGDERYEWCCINLLLKTWAALIDTFKIRWDILVITR
jgi:hypothetical protein